MSYNSSTVGYLKNFRIIRMHGNIDYYMLQYCESSNMIYEHTLQDLTDWLDKNNIQDIEQAKKLIQIINKLK